MAAGALDDAEALLLTIDPAAAHADDLDFLFGTIDFRRGDWQAAIARYRSVIARDPDRPVVRLQLGLAHFMAGEDRRAGYHLRRALADDRLAESFRRRAAAVLDRIKRRKRWHLTGSAALVPDTNINSGTEAGTVSLFGLPGRVSDDSRPTSGVGFAASVSGEYEHPLAEDLRFRTALRLDAKVYRESRFNERVLSARLGPRFLFGRSDLRVELTARESRLGGEVSGRELGGELSGSWNIRPAWRLEWAAGSGRTDYAGVPGPGRLDSARAGVSHVLSQSVTVGADIGLRRERLERGFDSWRESRFGAYAAFELPRGFLVRAGPGFVLRAYDAPFLPLGPDARRDATVAGHVTVSNRRLDAFGFMPEVTLRHVRRKSNINLNSYERTVLELGVRRSF